MNKLFSLFLGEERITYHDTDSVAQGTETGNRVEIGAILRQSCCGSGEFTILIEVNLPLSDINLKGYVRIVGGVGGVCGSCTLTPILSPDAYLSPVEGVDPLLYIPP